MKMTHRDLGVDFGVWALRCIQFCSFSSNLLPQCVIPVLENERIRSVHVCTRGCSGPMSFGTDLLDGLLPAALATAFPESRPCSTIRNLGFGLGAPLITHSIVFILDVATVSHTSNRTPVMKVVAVCHPSTYLIPALNLLFTNLKPTVY